MSNSSDPLVKTHPVPQGESFSPALRRLGWICAVLAGVSYGTNPLWAHYLYEDGLNVHSVLFFRFLLAIPGFLLMMARKRIGVLVGWRDFLWLALLGFLMSGSSIPLFMSFQHIDSGLACTLLFIYPLMVAVLGAILFRERMGWITWGALFVALPGIWLLSKPGDSTAFNMTGFWLVMLSAFSYALYMVLIHKTKTGKLPAELISFYAALFCALGVYLHSLLSPDTAIRLLPTARSWWYMAGLAIFPTVISLFTLAVAIRYVGSTPTAIIGALEPVTAVFIGVLFFHEAFSMRYALGIVLILFAVTTVVVTSGRKGGKAGCSSASPNLFTARYTRRARHRLHGGDREWRAWMKGRTLFVSGRAGPGSRFAPSSL